MEYKVLSNIRHNDKDYVAGDTISDLTEEQAKALIEGGAIAAPEVAATAAEVADPAPAPTPDAVTPEAEVPADPEAPATAAPLDEDSESSIEDQVQANIAKDLADAEKVANTSGQPVDVTPSPEEVAATAAGVK